MRTGRGVQLLEWSPELQSHVDAHIPALFLFSFLIGHERRVYGSNSRQISTFLLLFDAKKRRAVGSQSGTRAPAVGQSLA